MNKDLNLQYEGLKDKIEVIEQDINNIEDILLNVVKATNTLDESKWKSTEKTKMDQEYVPYVNNLSINVPIALRKHLNLMKESVTAYEDLENEVIQDVDKKLSDTVG